MADSDSLAPSHSFTINSSATMADIAARVVSEFENEDYFEDEDALYRNEEEDSGSEFEFVVPGVEESFSPISAGEIFSNGQIMPLFPLFNSQIYSENENSLFNADSSSNSQIYGESESSLISEPKSPLKPLFPLFNADSSSNSRIYGESESSLITEPKSPLKPLFPLFNADSSSNSRTYGANANSSIFGSKIPVVKADSSSKSAISRQTESRSESSSSTIRLPLKKLLISERETSLTASASCSEDEAEDDLEGVNSGTYCVWTPPKVEMSKKSKSTGSSKRWKLRNLVHRSHSDGREKFVFLAAPKHEEEQQQQRRLSASSEKTKTKKIEKASPATVNGNKSSHNPQRDYYLRNRAIKESDRRKSYLPYKQDLVGFFGNVNSLSRTMQPF